MFILGSQRLLNTLTSRQSSLGTDLDQRSTQSGTNSDLLGSSPDIPLSNRTGDIPGPLNSGYFVNVISPNTTAVGAGGGPVFVVRVSVFHPYLLQFSHRNLFPCIGIGCSDIYCCTVSWYQHFFHCRHCSCSG
jgi:hypothetical protein